MKLTGAFLTAIIFVASQVGAQTAIPASSFFPSANDPRRVIYIELDSDETLVFDAVENGAYILDGRALEIYASQVEVRGPVVIRSFAEGSQPSVIPGTGSLGTPGPPGGNGSGDGAGGERGGRGGRGGTGQKGTTGRAAGLIVLSIDDLQFATQDARLKIDASGERGGKGQKGGKGGTGGRGGDGQDRECGGNGPGNAGAKGAAGAPGTGGQGGDGGAGGSILFSSTLCPQIKRKLELVTTGGKGGEAGDPGEVGQEGDPGEAGDGNSCGGGGSARDIAASPAEAYISPPASIEGQPGSVKCEGCPGEVCPSNEG